jgi:hypothetical protein
MRASIKVAVVAIEMLGITIISSGASARSQVTTKSESCIALKTRAAKVLPKGSFGPAWFCDFLNWNDPSVFVIGLHSGLPCPSSAGCDNLIDWFAVRKGDGRTLRWDVANMKTGAPF